MGGYSWASISGPVIWMTHFLVVYGAESIVCSRLASPDLHRGLVIGATASALAALAWCVRSGLRANWMPGSLALNGLAAVAMLWSGLASAILPSCAAPL